MFHVDWFMFAIPAAFILMDIITGVAQAVANKSLSSTIMREGLAHKLAFVFLLILAEMLEFASYTFDLAIQVPAVGAVAAAIVVMETLSILENVARMNPELKESKIFQLFDYDDKEVW